VTFDIRPAAEGDQAQLSELFDELDELHRQARPDIFRKSAGDARSRDDLAALIGEDGGTILVADRGGRLLGLAVALLRSPRSHPLLITRKVVEIDNVVVHRAAQRHDVEIGVHDFNTGAIAFYEAMGFEMSMHRLRRRLA
jgi:GNAT superfamily N-acetyltransferase